MIVVEDWTFPVKQNNSTKIESLDQWLQADIFEGFDPAWYKSIPLLNANKQRLCIRKLVAAHKLGHTVISRDGLSIILQDPKSFSIDTYLLVQCMHKVLCDGRLPYVMEIFNTIRNVYRGVSKEDFIELFETIKHSSLFDRCTGYSYVFNYDNYHRSSYNINKEGEECIYDPDYMQGKWVPISGTLKIRQDLSSTLMFNGYLEGVISLMKKMISSKKYDVENKVWHFPEGTINEVVNFLRAAIDYHHFFKIEHLYDKSSNVRYTAMMRKGANRDMCFCEGKQWNYPNLGNCYWCHGNAAFCDGVITHSDYHNYTLYDIIDIIGGDNKRQLGIQFVYSGYNRLASLIEHEHIFCKSCKCALEPKGDNGYNARRAIWFQCNNAQCDQYKKEIYLNHCFQENCGAIIDSRETSKCPNGFYICKTCGVCCANSQFKRKINANVNLGLYISTLIREGKMHLDGGVEPSFYCSTCGKKLTHIRFKTALKIDDNNYIYGYYKCPDHKDSLIVFPYSEYVKKKVLKYIHDYENDTQNRDGKDF